MSHNNTFFEGYSSMLHQQIQTTILYSVITPLVTSLLVAIGIGLKSIGPNLFNWSKNRVVKTPNAVHLSFSEITDSGGLQVHLNARAQIVINALVDFVTTRGLSSVENDVEVMCGNKSDLPAERNRVLHVRPRDNVVYNGFTININKQQLQDEDNSNGRKNGRSVYRDSFTVTVSAYKPVSEIVDFINECHKEYLDKYYPLNPKEDPPLYMYFQMPGDEHLRFKRYELQRPKNLKPFEKLYYPQKSELVDNLTRLQSGEHECLKILMTGPPGCGKSRTIRETAWMLKCHIIYVSLAHIKNDAMIMDLFHGNEIAYYNHNDASFGLAFTNVPHDRRIYVFEDIDAESDVVLRRSLQRPRSPSPARYGPSKPKTNKLVTGGKTKQPEYEDESDEESDSDSNHSSRSYNRRFSWSDMTLKGLLNALDGIIPLVGPIVFMTTNHPEKLDPALIRGGRVHMRINLNYMTTADAKLLIRSYFGGEIDIPDLALPPCELEAFCKTSNGLADLQQKINAYLNGEYEDDTDDHVAGAPVANIIEGAPVANTVEMLPVVVDEVTESI